MAVNYSGFAPKQFNPMEGVQQGFQLANLAQTGQMNKLKLEQAQALHQKKMAFQTELAAIGDKPTARAYSDLIIKYPVVGAGLKSSMDMLNDQQKDAAFKNASNVYSALRGGQPELAKKLLEQQQVAAKNSGNQQQADSLEVMLKVLDADPTENKQSALHTAGLLLSATNQEKFAEMNEKLSTTAQKQDLHPVEVQLKNVEFMEKGRKIGLSKGQMMKILSSTKGLSSQTRELALELEQSKDSPNAIYDPEKKFEFEKGIRKEYNDVSKVVNGSKLNHKKMELSAKDGSGAGDVALITTFMKILDEGSTVREAEFDAAKDTAGLMATLENWLNKLQGGEFLKDSQRKTFVNLAGKYVKAAEQGLSTHKKGFKNLINDYGLEQKNIFGMDAEQDVKPVEEMAPEERQSEIQRILGGS